MTTRDFAAHIGVSQATVTNAEGDAVKVRPIVIRAWSLATGVPVEWLETGNVPQPEGPGDGLRARRDPNPKPSDPKVLYLRQAA